MKEFFQEELEKLMHLDTPLSLLAVISTLCRRLPADLHWQLLYHPTDSAENFIELVEKIGQGLVMERQLRGTQHVNHNENRGSRNGGHNQGNHNRERNLNENGRGNNNRGDNWENRSQRETWENDRRNQRQEGGNRNGDNSRRENQRQNQGN